MATANSIGLGKDLAPTQGIYISAATTGNPLILLRYLGDTASGATVAVDSNGNIAFTTDGTTADTTVFATTGVLDLSTPAAGLDTVGEVLDTINGSANWHAVLAGGYRAMASDGIFTTITETDVSTAAMKASGFLLYGDGAVSPYIVAGCITGLDAGTIEKGDNPDGGCYSVITYIQCNLNTSSAGTLEVWRASQTGETKIFTVALADATTTTFGNGVSTLFKSKVGERLVVVLDSDQSAPGSGGFLVVNGYTVDTAGAAIRGGVVLSNLAG
jgi:hypothetical protein